MLCDTFSCDVLSSATQELPSISCTEVDCGYLFIWKDGATWVHQCEGGEEEQGGEDEVEQDDDIDGEELEEEDEQDEDEDEEEEDKDEDDDDDDKPAPKSCPLPSHLGVRDSHGFWANLVEECKNQGKKQAKGKDNIKGKGKGIIKGKGKDQIKGQKGTIKGQEVGTIKGKGKGNIKGKGQEMGTIKSNGKGTIKDSIKLVDQDGTKDKLKGFQGKAKGSHQELIKKKVVIKPRKCNSRHLEHSRVYHQIYEESINKGWTPESAKGAARKAAHKHVSKLFG
jgi:hypothetical protein